MTQNILEAASCCKKSILLNEVVSGIDLCDIQTPTDLYNRSLVGGVWLTEIVSCERFLDAL